jgi:hypothetical protein
MYAPESVSSLFIIDSSIANAVASFFTPASQKQPQKITWQERASSDDTPNTLIVGKYLTEDDLKTKPSELKAAGKNRRKVAAFDLVRNSPEFSHHEI